MNASTLESILTQIKDLYLADSRPWIIGYSGGKDSTTVMQLVFEALHSLPKSKLKKKIYVLSSDTLVEAPPVIAFIETNLRKMTAAAKAMGLPLSTHMVRPEYDQTFWVNIIGKGYPSPTTSFRWCTDRMKINPANKFIRERVSEHGEVIMLLGTRRSESATRAQSMALHEIEGTFLKRHTSLLNAFVYAPIEFLSTNEVWIYLQQVESPWGGDNKALVSLYKSAQAGECPLVVDKTTPSCGNSRFGCWTCTVVERDKSMESMIDNGEEWMLPLLEFRDWLKEIREPEKGYRSYKRRGGGTYFNPDGSRGVGPFTLDARKKILERLLSVQKGIKHPLIHAEELRQINRCWIEDGDWDNSVQAILDTVGLRFDELELGDDRGIFGGEEGRVLSKLCEAEGVPVELVKKLLNIEKDVNALARRKGIMDRLDSALAEEWKTERELDEERSALRASNA
jgi:DNA sulfur modification protein DndC